MESIRIKCPVCGVVLSAKDDPKNAGKYVTCPNCHEKRKFSEFKRVVPRIPTDVDESTERGNKELPDEKTELTSPKDASPGYLFDRKTGMYYALSKGVSIVGRKPLKSAPKADIPIVTTDQGMSRAHMKVKVTLAVDGCYHVYVSNAENMNPTYINGELLADEDWVGIRHRDIIKLCDTELVYMGNPLDDETE
jgi:uncharacterized Zn finger protein (UPF0148 family)